MADALAKFLATHDWALLHKVMDWQVERDGENPDVVRLTLPARDGQLYILRCRCDGYPETPPSVKFVSGDASESVMSAWPTGDTEFLQVVKPPPHCFLCTDLTREGLEHHGDWRSRPGAWSGTTKTLMDIFNYAHRLLKSKGYGGRAG